MPDDIHATGNVHSGTSAINDLLFRSMLSRCHAVLSVRDPVTGRWRHFRADKWAFEVAHRAWT